MSSFDDCKNWPKYCVPFTCQEPGKGSNQPSSSVGECRAFPLNDGPNNTSHDIHTQYALSICGVSIDLLKTDRSFSTKTEWTYAIPKAVNGIWIQGNADYWCYGDFTPEIRNFRMKEDCVIIKSTLYYLDQRYGVCLYRKNIEQIKFDVTTSDTNLFKQPYGTTRVSSIKLYGGGKKNWNNNCTEEWHLVKDGVDAVIATTSYEPIGEMSQYASYGSEVLFDKNYKNKADKDLQLIISTSPPTGSNYIPWDDELRYHGFYSYIGGSQSEYWSPDGGCADYYYPAWCRSLHVDAYWKQAAEERIQAYWPDYVYRTINNYTPPEDILVSSLPIGTYAKHPAVGEVYQFLLSKRDNKTHLATNKDFTQLVNGQLQLSDLSIQEESDLNKLLCYPIGVI